MAKLTKKTTKVGQKCKLLKDSDLFHRIIYIKNRELLDNEKGYNTSYNNYLSCYVTDENSHRYIGDAEKTTNKFNKYNSKSKTLTKGTVVEVVEYDEKSWSLKDTNTSDGVYQDWASNVRLKVIGGEHDGLLFVADLTSIQGRLETGDFEDLAATLNEAPKYKIFFNGKPYKTKIFSDLTKIKASLMDAIGYNDKVSNLNRHYQELSPEV